MKDTQKLETGIRIRHIREYLHYTREELAEKLDVSPKYISDIESGARGMSTATLLKISELLHVTTDYILLGREEYTDNAPVISAFRLVDKRHVKSAEELLKLFIKSLDE